MFRCTQCLPCAPAKSLVSLTLFALFVAQVHTRDEIAVQQSQFLNPAAFIFLYDSQVPHRRLAAGFCNLGFSPSATSRFVCWSLT